MKFLNNLDLQQNQIQNFRVHNLAEAPANPVAGQHYFNTVTKLEYVFDGEKWVDALSQGDYTFQGGIEEIDGRKVQLTAATKDAIGGVQIGDNIDVEGGVISVKSGNKEQAGLLQLASDEEAAAGVNDAKAVTAKQVEAQIQEDIKDKIELTDLSATGPILYDNATGIISADFDTEATADSNKLMKSGAIKAELDKKLDKTTFEGAKLSDFADDTDENPVKFAQNLTGLNTTVSELNEIHEAGVVKADLVKLHDVTATAAELNVLDGITASTDELNIMDGVTATTAEINVLDGITATTAELNELHEGTAVKADFIKLHGITASAAELNTMKGIEASTAELNTMKGITSTTAELNQLHEAGAVKADFVKLHAIEVTAEQINAIAEVDAEDLAKLADITASAEEINVLDGIEASTAELNILKGATLDVNELNILDGATLTTDELNILDGVTVGKDEINALDGIEGNVQELLDAKVDRLEVKPAAGQYTKVTINAEGQVTAGAQLEAADIPDLSETYVNVNRIGAANGVASLDENGLVPAAQLPAYVDDVIDILCVAAEAPATCAKGDKYYNSVDKKIYVATEANVWGEGATPETDKIYVNLSNNMAYRWSGSTMVQIGADKLLGFNGVIEGDAATSTFTINHNLGTRNVVFEIYEANSPYEKVYVQVLHTSTTALQVVFGAAPAVGENYNITVIAIG